MLVEQQKLGFGKKNCVMFGIFYLYIFCIHLYFLRGGKEKKKSMLLGLGLVSDWPIQIFIQ